LSFNVLWFGPVAHRRVRWSASPVLAVIQPSSEHVLGIDAGGTKTVCLLAQLDGTLVSEARAGGANLQAVGELEVEKVLHLVMDQAIGDRPIVPTAICLGMAGVDREDDAAVVRAIMRRIGYKAQVTVTNDALVALVAGAGHDPGIVVIAGTGSIAYGRNARGDAARAGGWGYVLGDEGSGYWIGRLALRAVVRQSDGRGRPTSLTPRILQHFDVPRAQDLIHEVYYRGMRPAAIASVAAHVQAAFDEGDETAVSILENGARELVGCAASVAAQLHMRDEVFRFVLAGGMFRAVPWLATALGVQLPHIAPRAAVERLDHEPAVGAVRLAIALARGEPRVPIYKST
jgi:N-acetylglucosamine kinase-like BadF-type ATPase